MWWVLGAVGVLVIVVGTAVMIGSTLPREHVATVRSTFASPPDLLWKLIADPAAAMSWRTDLKSVSLLPLLDGKVAWEEVGSSGKVRYVTAESDRPRRFVSRIASEDLPFGGQWEHDLAPSGNGTMLATTERGFVKPALFRFLAHYVLGYTSTMDAYHRALAAKLGETVTPEVVASGR